jgi:hypothetical protein
MTLDEAIDLALLRRDDKMALQFISAGASLEDLDAALAFVHAKDAALRASTLANLQRQLDAADSGDQLT